MGEGRPRRLRIGIASGLAIVALAVTASPAAAQLQLLPVPGISPPGANDFDCVPRAGRPPVILVHGTLFEMTSTWPVLTPMLVADGFCVFALDYGRRGTAPVDDSADELAAFTRDVLDATGAPKVSFVGHSQGGLLARWATKSRGLLDWTQDIVGLAPSHHGTTAPAAPAVAGLGCMACDDQVAGSAFLALANSDPEAPPAVDHTVITTIYDEVVTPPQSQALSGETVGNVVLQDQCPGDLVEHVGIVFDPVALNWVRHALLRDGPANPAARADCSGSELPEEPPPVAPAPAPDPPDPPASSSSSPPPAAVPLRLELLSTELRASRSGRVRVRVRCSGPQDGRCTSLIRLRRGDRVLGTLRATLPAERTATLTLVLSQTGRRFVAAHRAGARVTLRATTDAASPRATSRTLTLRRG